MSQEPLSHIMCSNQFAVCHALYDKIICYTIYCLPIDISEDSYKIVFTVHSYKDTNILHACLYLLLVLFVLSVSLHRELADSGHTLWFLLWQPLFILFPYLTQLLQTNGKICKCNSTIVYEISLNNVIYKYYYIYHHYYLIGGHRSNQY